MAGSGFRQFQQKRLDEISRVRDRGAVSGRRGGGGNTRCAARAGCDGRLRGRADGRRRIGRRRPADEVPPGREQVIQQIFRALIPRADVGARARA